ncbi:hypothetical protein E2C01_011226 [Portunus trituberculatus]|uniref:Uncharacterized protein n=1 Tax=Portunus trituberculatus TaxID=210409 RepID=A0A5B7DAR4_PORTR|nr:hypothetical protein [Portunus trituberculatus]
MDEDDRSKARRGERHQHGTAHQFTTSSPGQPVLRAVEGGKLYAPSLVSAATLPAWERHEPVA